MHGEEVLIKIAKCIFAWSVDRNLDEVRLPDVADVCGVRDPVPERSNPFSGHQLRAAAIEPREHRPNLFEGHVRELPMERR